jgi:diaminopimelate decarboxylase
LLGSVLKMGGGAKAFGFDQAWLPRAQVGDLVAIFCAGAYGASASPAAFLGQGPAREMLV